MDKPKAETVRASVILARDVHLNAMIRAKEAKKSLSVYIAELVTKDLKRKAAA